MEEFLVDLVRAELARRNVTGDRGRGVEDFSAAAVIAAELQREDGVLIAQLLRVLKLADDRAP